MPAPVTPLGPGDRAVLWLAQGGGIGRLRPAPGTWGSLLGIGWFLLLIAPGSSLFLLVGTVLGVVLAVPLCTRAERLLGETDPSSVVLDEIVALPVTLLGYAAPWLLRAHCPPPLDALREWWLALPAGFALFRLFDIWKPWPIRRLQHLPGGWGIVLDDVAAGLVAAGLLWLGTFALFVKSLALG